MLSFLLSFGLISPHPFLQCSRDSFKYSITPYVNTSSTDCIIYDPRITQIVILSCYILVSLYRLAVMLSQKGISYVSLIYDCRKKNNVRYTSSLE